MGNAVLSPADFARYFKNGRLGRLDFPNGECKIPHGCYAENAESVPFFVDLHALFKLLTGWRVNGVEVPLDEIVSVIAFGSAVKYPGYKMVKKPFRLWGPTHWKVPIQPDDADFLVVTEKNLMREKVLKPLSLETYDCGTWILEGGIHLVNRGVSQLTYGIRAKDTIGINALRQGVPIFSTRRWKKVARRAGVKKETPRTISWDENRHGQLVGRIK